MPLPNITGQNLKKPLCYDPSRKKFILFDDIVSGRERIVPLESLTADERKQLVIERQRQGGDYTAQAISGPPHSRNDVITAIERDDAFGNVTVEAEVSYLKELLEQIQAHLRATKR